MLVNIVKAKPATRGCLRLAPKWQAVESGLSNVARREFTGLPVYESRPKSIPYRMQNMEKLKSWATLFVAARTARQGSGDSIEMTEEANAERVMRRICPRRSGLSLQKKPSNHRRRKSK